MASEVTEIVHKKVEEYARQFKNRHISQVNNPEGTINMKIHNVFIESLGNETKYYTSLVRSLDSSLGNMLEKMAIDIAKLNFNVKKRVEGKLYTEQTHIIADLLEKYKRHEIKPKTSDYATLRDDFTSSTTKTKRHESDYYLINEDTNHHYLIELKIGGDLDNKKARSEKEALLEQYAILSNTLDATTPITTYFATAYNRYGENKAWKQERVRQFFAEEELLIGKDFWNFVCCSDSGYKTVLDAYNEKAQLIKDALNDIKRAYLR